MKGSSSPRSESASAISSRAEPAPDNPAPITAGSFASRSVLVVFSSIPTVFLHCRGCLPGNTGESCPGGQPGRATSSLRAGHAAQPEFLDETACRRNHHPLPHLWSMAQQAVAAEAAVGADPRRNQEKGARHPRQLRRLDGLAVEGAAEYQNQGAVPAPTPDALSVPPAVCSIAQGILSVPLSCPRQLAKCGEEWSRAPSLITAQMRRAWVYPWFS